MIASTLPAGFNLITAGLFQGTDIAAFGFKQTPVTNQEFGAVGRNQFVLLDHDWNTGQTRLQRSGRSVEEVVGGPVFVPEGIHFDQGDILVLGSTILLKMAENPSAQCDDKKRVLSPEFKRPNDYFYGPYGLRGGSWFNDPVDGRAAFRSGNRPDDRSFDVGFSPVVVRQDSSSLLTNPS